MKLKSLLIAALALSLPYPASANLIFDSSLGGVSGSGLGTVATILTIQSPGSTSTESGSVSFNGTTDVTSNTGVLAGGAPVSFGDVKTGASQTLTRTLGSVGITSAGQLAIVLNASEPAGNSITLTGLRLDIFNPAGTSIFNASLASSQAFATTFTGTGNEGFVFKLDTAQGSALNSVLAGLTASQVAALRVGLSASASEATGGLETFNLSQITASTAVPEPATLLLLGTALMAGAGWSYTLRRR
jgi:PEP-CTERM motif-containing protein